MIREKTWTRRSRRRVRVKLISSQLLSLSNATQFLKARTLLVVENPTLHQPVLMALTLLIARDQERSHGGQRRCRTLFRSSPTLQVICNVHSYSRSSKLLASFTYGYGCPSRPSQVLTRFSS
ncbi:hypothetical protein I315_00031 [Cryptococcus gattii Ru294]|nr:hypothetical protein I315_00031 [Cryptococcus gattii Ru294]